MAMITKRKPKRGGWQTLATGYHKGGSRAIVVALDTHNIILRLKGTRREVVLPIAIAYIYAANAAARLDREAREEKKRQRRGIKPPRRRRSRTVRRGILALKG
jgi:hypothetical protein